jgi:hypothetical protein
MKRRDSRRWMLAAASAAAWAGAGAAGAPAPGGKGIGTDPDLLARHRSGDLWPLTFTPAQARCAAALCDVILPADDRSPAASTLEVHVFIDEWISAPYPDQQADRAVILEGLAWVDGESMQRHGRPFADASPGQQHAVCDDICWLARAKPEHAGPARFFARFRDLAAGGFYTTPEGTRDLQFAGNVPLESFAGPTAAVLALVGVS